MRTMKAFSVFFLVSMAAASVSAATFKTIAGEVVIEAEKYTRLGGSKGGTWYKNTAISGFSGLGYMNAGSVKINTLKFASDIARVEYDIDFQQTGIYYLHLRTYAEDHTQNGFFATMDGSHFFYGSPIGLFVHVKAMQKNPRWWWYTQGGKAGAKGSIVSINIKKKGVQTFAIYRRDWKSRVDLIWLTKHVNTPKGTGSLKLKDPSLFEVGQPSDGGSGSLDASDGGSGSLDAFDDGTLLADSAPPTVYSDMGPDAPSDGPLHADSAQGTTTRPRDGCAVGREDPRDGLLVLLVLVTLVGFRRRARA